METACIKLLQADYKGLEQQQDANYELLIKWNPIWQSLVFMDEFQGKIRSYRSLQYKYAAKRTEKEIQHLEAEIQELENTINAANSRHPVELTELEALLVRARSESSGCHQKPVLFEYHCIRIAQSNTKRTFCHCYTAYWERYFLFYVPYPEMLET